MSKLDNRNVKLFFRVFPTESVEWNYLKIDDKTIYMRYLQELSNINQNQKPPAFWEFKTDGVFFNSDQEYVYSNVMEEVLDRVVEGYNAVVLAFGQTRSGKTVTLGGLQLSEQDFGIAPRVIYDLFKIKNGLPANIKMCIQMSITEFSNRTAADLLKKYPYAINVYHCREATKIKIRSEYEGLKLLYKGEGRKIFAGNNEYLSNLCSSVVTFHITTANTDLTTPRKNCSRLHIIDMAGVDTVGNASSNYKRPPEIGKANIIKTNLEQFVLCLKENIPFHIKLKERTNPLIYFLGSDLSNESIFRFIGHIKTTRDDLLITISMLRFGRLVRGLKPKQKEIISEENENVKLQHLQNQLDALEKQKLHNSVLLNQDLTQNINQDRLEHLQRIIHEYLKDQVSEITVLNVAEAVEVFRVFKEMCKECEAEKSKLCEEIQLETVSKIRRGSKASSKTSLKTTKGATRKPSRKSKDSFTSGEKLMGAEKRTSKRSSMSGSQLNKRGSNSLSMKRSSVSRRRSTTSTSIAERKELKCSEIILMPDIIPDFPEAWKTFLKDNDSFYKILLEDYKANENDIQSDYSVYLTEIKKLQCHKEILEKRKTELFEAQMIRSFNMSEILGGSEELLIIGSTEKLCQENINKAQDNLIKQQEIVLKWQSEIKICLNKRQDIKKQLNEEFDAYCKEKFSVIVPVLAENDPAFQEETTKIDIELVVKESVEDKTCAEKEEKEVMLNNLKKIMEKELLRHMKFKAKEINIWKKFTFKP